MLLDNFVDDDVDKPGGQLAVMLLAAIWNEFWPAGEKTKFVTMFVCCWIFLYCFELDIFSLSDLFKASDVDLKMKKK